MLKPTISGAVASITKAVKQLDAVVANAGKAVEEADKTISIANAKRIDAESERERAARIKARLEELVA